MEDVEILEAYNVLQEMLNIVGALPGRDGELYIEGTGNRYGLVYDHEANEYGWNVVAYEE